MEASTANKLSMDIDKNVEDSTANNLLVDVGKNVEDSIANNLSVDMCCLILSILSLNIHIHIPYEIARESWRLYLTRQAALLRLAL